MGDTLLKNDSSESTELMPLIEVPMQNNPFDLLPNEIFDGVFRLLDKPSLKQTRAVCRKWNDFALSFLSKTPGWVHFSFFNYVDKEGVERLPQRIQKLQSTLSLTEHPEMLFSKLSITKCALEREIPLLNLLHQFGSTLKSLKFSSVDLTLPILREILENWCANLEELDLFAITVTEDENNNIQGFEISPTPLKQLNLRKFNFNDGFLPPKLPAPDVQNFFLSILKSSPKLQVLYMRPQHNFWKKIQMLPEITKNLEEVNISTLRFSKAISDASFSNKLTSLTLFIRGDSFPKEQLVRFLKKVGESLEKLRLHLNVRLDWKFQPDRQLPSMINFKLFEYFLIQPDHPLMRKLKLLEYIFNHELIFDSIDFLKQFPNLEILRLHRFVSFEHTNQTAFMDTLFSNASYLPLHPHKTLNTMYFTESPKQPETIFAINRMFPNIRDLTLALDCSELPESTREGWLTSICTGFSEMENLKILHLHHHDSLRWDQKINFEACFSPLEASQSLVDLTITRNHERYYGAEKFPPGLEKVVVKIPKLKILGLHKFYMEKSESMKLLKTLDQMGFFFKEGKVYLW